jgi:hypothetical protein
VEPDVKESAADKVRALGFSQTPFDVAKPGRLCRGRERWIEPWQSDEKPDPIVRTIFSGAIFTDDSARDASRGLPFSGLELVDVLTALFPRKTFLAFMEDGHPADIPEGAEGVEAYEGYRAGGRSEFGLVRWRKRIAGVRELTALLGPDPLRYTDRVRGFVVITPSTDDDVVWRSLFEFVGMGSLDSPPAQYQPAALPNLLTMVKAVAVIHRDKHGPALGIYTQEPFGLDKVTALCAKKGSLPVKFAIPPMLARWDRALSETRAEWVENGDMSFPVRPASEPSSWQSRFHPGPAPLDTPTQDVTADLTADVTEDLTADVTEDLTADLTEDLTADVTIDDDLLVVSDLEVEVPKSQEVGAEE